MFAVAPTVTFVPATESGARKMSVPGGPACARVGVVTAATHVIAPAMMIDDLVSSRRMSTPDSGDLLQLDEQRTLLHCLTGRDEHALHASRRLRAKLVLHLHRFH